MQHYYLDSSFGKDNWFTYQKVYTDFAHMLPNDGLFVEIGSWTGRSACYLGVEIINLNKIAKIDCIDIWPDDINTLLFNNTIKQKYDNSELYKQFLHNTQPLNHIISNKRMSSDEAVSLYDNNSIDILFIDGDHSYKGVRNDINNYLPKIKKGGIISGHDYTKNWPGVVQAVKEIFQDKIKLQQGCWIKQL